MAEGLSLPQWYSTSGAFFQSFSCHRPKWLWNDRKNLSHFGQNVWKSWLKNTVMGGLIQLRQMTKMFQWP